MVKKLIHNRMIPNRLIFLRNTALEIVQLNLNFKALSTAGVRAIIVRKLYKVTAVNDKESPFLF